MGIPWRALGPASIFLASGTLHFTRAAPFREIVPPGLGDPALLVALSGVAELAGGIGLLVPVTRRAAAYGLVALTLAVWPANWNMALNAGRYAALAPAWALWLRVPLQVPLIWRILTCARSAP